MEAAGLVMLVLVAALLTTGLPAWVVLIGVSLSAALVGVAVGGLDGGLLVALAPRLVGLLENDLLQALPLYVLMGALLNRLPLAGILFRAGTAAMGGHRSGPLVSAMGLGALLAPMNGSVAASVATLSRVVLPRLRAHGVPTGKGLAVVCVASTLGVVVPPSLVLILLGDAMMRADTEAANAVGRVAGQMVRVINTQDVFRGALAPAALFLLLCLILSWWSGRRRPIPDTADMGTAPAEPPLGLAGWATAVATLLFVGGLLAAVAAGYLYAVEAAAMGAVALLVFGLVSRSLDRSAMEAVLHDTMAVTGALFALFVGATSFTLVFRGFGTDRLLDGLVAALPGGAAGATLGVMAMIAVCAFVLDAFEIIFVVIPVLMPPLLVRVPDAVWVSVLVLLTLQVSFLIPPLGYAVMMVRSAAGAGDMMRGLIRALAPYLAAQAVVLSVTLAVPSFVHVMEPPDDPNAAPVLSDEDAKDQLRSMIPMPPDDD